MHIDGLAPLQNWLDKINDYLTKDETTKARLATLVLPFFEALGCLCIIRKICFPLSRDHHESQSQLLTKASHLALNIIRAPINGWRSPQDTYQQHIELNLIIDPFQAIEQQLKQAAPVSAPLNHDLKQKIIEPELVVSPPLAKKQKPRRHVQDIIKSIRNAPDFLRKRDSFQVMTQEKAKETVRHHKTLPRNVQLVDKIPGEENFPDPKDELANLQRLLEEQSSPEKLTEKPQQKNEKALAVFGPLIHKNIPKRGTWKVKNNHIYFKKGRTACLDPRMIDVIAAAKDKGLFSELNYDQTYILYQNLLIIDGLETKKNRHMGKLMSVMEALQNQFKTLWVEQEYLCGQFHRNCLKLLDLIQQGQGKPNEENLGLFSNSTAQDIVRIFDDWQSANSIVQKNKAPVKQTIDDYYEILKAYFKEIPPALRSEWKHLKEASTKDEFLPILRSLSAKDQQLLTQFLRFFSIAFKEIWAPSQDEKLTQEEKIHMMLQETKNLLQWICPNAEQNQFGALAEVILNFDTIFPN